MSVAAPLAWSAAAASFLALRLWPIWPRRFQGCDAYYILLCAEAFRRRPRLPIRLPPVYLLEEEEQWYPPGFLLLCAAIPPRLLERHYWLVNHLVDLGSGSIVFALASLAGQPLLGAAAMVVYALSPGLVLEYASLTTRPLGQLL